MTAMYFSKNVEAPIRYYFLIQIYAQVSKALFRFFGEILTPKKPKLLSRLHVIRDSNAETDNKLLQMRMEMGTSARMR
jgi:hypothetical protein